MNAIGYVRVSTQEQAKEGISVDNQEALAYKTKEEEYLGSPPLGFEAVEKELKRNDDELAVVQEVFRLKRGYRGKNRLSLREIAKRLNEAGFTGKRGAKFYHGTVIFLEILSILRFLDNQWIKKERFLSILDFLVFET